MKTFFGLFFLSMSLWGQNIYTVSKTTTLSSSAEIITVQQPATGALITRFISAFVDSASGCAFTIERNGTPASSTALTPVAANPSVTPAATTTAWYSSNVGVGSVITRATLPAGGGIVVDLSKVFLQKNDMGQNLTVRTASCSGVVDIVITYSEANY